MKDMDKAIEEAWPHEGAAAAVLPFESWERLPGESSHAYAAFIAFRDLGLERTIRKAVETAEKDMSQWDKRYRVWRNWCSAYRWRERVADYDRYLEKLKQTELRKTIEAQGEKHREATGKILDVVIKKFDLMNPADLSNSEAREWTETAVRLDREGAQLSDADCSGGAASRNSGPSVQGELHFSSDFEGI